MTARLWISTLVATLLMPTIPVNAASFTVTACDSAPDGIASTAWTYAETTSSRFDHGTGCSNAPGSDTSGLYVRELLDQGTNTPGGASAGWTLEAPATTSITGITYGRHLRTYLDDGWVSQLRADATPLESCRVPVSDDTCELGSASGAPTTFTDLAAQRLWVGIECQPTAPATSCTSGSMLHRAQATLFGASVTIDDPTAPSVSALEGSLAGGGWMRGRQSVAFSASDATGIDRLELLRDDALLLADDRVCDYTRPAPCAEPGLPVSAAWTSVDTTSWPDGSHVAFARASDAAGNMTATAPVSVKVDSTPPGAPDVSADSAWDIAPDATWKLPLPVEADRAPIAALETEVCRAGVCTTKSVSDPPSQAVLTRPVDEGITTLRARLRDGAGNLGPWSVPVAVQRDRGAPPAPSFGRWRRKAPGAYRIPLSVVDAGPAPITTVAGRACFGSTDRCRKLSSDSVRELVTPVLRPGHWRLRVHAVDAARNAGPDGSTTLDVPRHRVKLIITRARLTEKRVVVRGRMSSSGAKGHVRLIAREADRRHTRSVRLFGGSFRASLKRPVASTGSVRLMLRYSGDASYAPTILRRTIRSSASLVAPER